MELLRFLASTFWCYRPELPTYNKGGKEAHNVRFVSFSQGKDSYSVVWPFGMVLCCPPGVVESAGGWVGLMLSVRTSTSAYGMQGTSHNEQAGNQNLRGFTKIGGPEKVGFGG